MCKMSNRLSFIDKKERSYKNYVSVSKYKECKDKPKLIKMFIYQGGKNGGER